MYLYGETPMLSATVFYFDQIYEEQIPLAVKSMLELHGFFPPCYLYADRLTRGRVQKYRPEMEDFIVRTYTEPELGQFSISSANPDTAREYWEMQWWLTFYKYTAYREVHRPGAFVPWNGITYHSTYGKLCDESYLERFFACFEDTIGIVRPFCASVDDMSISAQLILHPEGHGTLQRRYGQVNAVYWGNYFSPEYCQIYGLTPDLLPKDVRWKEIAGGILFYLSESPWDLAGQEVFRLRKTISRRLGIAPPRIPQSELLQIETMLKEYRNEHKAAEKEN